MKRWTENRTFALCALLAVAGIVLAIATAEPTQPGARLRAALRGGAHADTVAVRP
jgi:hypothetical protein